MRAAEFQPAGFAFATLQFFQADVPVPDWLTVILKADVTGAGKILESRLEFVLAAIGIQIRRCPIVEIGFENFLAVQDDLDE